MKEFRKIGFFFQNRLHWQFEVGEEGGKNTTAVLCYIFTYK